MFFLEGENIFRAMGKYNAGEEIRKAYINVS
jgi:hypothetical protein